MERLLLQQQPEGSSASKSRLSGPAASSSTSTPLSVSRASAPASDRPRAGKGSRGPRPRLFSKGQCQADGCTADLHNLPRYNQRNHICLHHKSAETFFKMGAEVRFCQRCGVSHPLAEYDGLKKSCRRMLALHNSRRRKSGDATSTTPAATSASGPAPLLEAAPLQLQVQQQQREEQPQLQQPAAQLLPAVAGMQLGVGHAGGEARGEPSPAASVGSAAALSEDGSGWLLAEGGSEGASLADATPLPDPPPPFWPEEGQQGGASAGAVPLVAAVPTAAPHPERVCGAPQHECVCCGTCRASAGCCGGAAAAGAAPLGGAGGRALVGGAAAGAGAAGAGAGGSELAAGPECRPAHDGPQPELSAVAGPAAGGLGSSVDDTADSAARPAAVSGMAPAAEAAANAAPNTAAAAALAQLQQRNAALYQVFVQQQLLAAQTLLTTAGMVLSQSLPLPQPTSSSSVSAR